MQDRFAKITTDYAKINTYVHDTAVMIAEHAKEHGDCSTAQGLVMAMPASARREMLILWFKLFTPIVVKNEDDWTAKMHKEGTKLFVPFDIEAGKAKPFYELANENKERGPMTLEELLALVPQLAKRINKKIEDGEVSDEALPTAEALAAQLSKLNVKTVKPKASNDAAGEDENPALAAA
jgi:hypothetical protein